MCNINDANKKSQQNAGAQNAKDSLSQSERLREFQESEKEKAATQGKPQTNERQGDSCEGFDCM
ncbi:MAG: hypothetical protein GX776_07650 [Oxalobacter sp.]|nr:hypothetical protein [Oxalobacter sp.]